MKKKKRKKKVVNCLQDKGIRLRFNMFTRYGIPFLTAFWIHHFHFVVCRRCYSGFKSMYTHFPLTDCLQNVLLSLSIFSHSLFFFTPLSFTWLFHFVLYIFGFLKNSITPSASCFVAARRDVRTIQFLPQQIWISLSFLLFSFLYFHWRKTIFLLLLPFIFFLKLFCLSWWKKIASQTKYLTNISSFLS